MSLSIRGHSRRALRLRYDLPINHSPKDIINLNKKSAVDQSRNPIYGTFLRVGFQTLESCEAGPSKPCIVQVMRVDVIASFTYSKPTYERLGCGCGTLGRAVSSDARDSWFESSHW